jgi:hypothetical protein
MEVAPAVLPTRLDGRRRRLPERGPQSFLSCRVHVDRELQLVADLDLLEPRRYEREQPRPGNLCLRGRNADGDAAKFGRDRDA